MEFFMFKRINPPPNFSYKRSKSKTHSNYITYYLYTESFISVYSLDTLLSIG